MPTYVQPVVLWPEPSGGWVGALVGDYDGTTACGDSPRELLRQFKEYLDWKGEHDFHGADPDFHDAQVVQVKVDLRPQYTDETGKRVIPCAETIIFNVPCVLGRSENGLLLCEVPHLRMGFTYHDGANVRDLVKHYVREAMRGQTPRGLAQLKPPAEIRLENIAFRSRHPRQKAVHPRDREDFKVLFTVADPLLQDRAKGSAAYGREDWVQVLVNKLVHERANVLLVGEAGVGKSTIILDAARKLSKLHGEDEDSTDLRAWKFWRGSAARMIAGMRYLGQWEERAEEFISQLDGIEGIYCAENLLEFVRVGGRSPVESVAAFLIPYLQRGELRMIAEVTPSELNACRRLLPGVLDSFQILFVPPFSHDQALEILNRVALSQASSRRISFEPGAVALAHRLFGRFLPDSAFPGPAAAFVRGLVWDAMRDKRKEITLQAVVAAFIKQTGLPEMFLRDELLLPTSEIRDALSAQVIGQPQAIDAAVNVVASIKTGLADPGRPPGVLLFCGPTGVGKTALAKALADFCFGSGSEKDRLVRLDMSEYGSWGAAERLLLGQDGEAAPWIQKVRRQPFSVVLFDEIEKASPEVFDVLLGLLDEGRLTDRFGRTTSFRSAIILLTSNIGSTAPAPMGFNQTDAPAYDQEVRKFFRPEFFNRLDAVVTFHALSEASVKEIAHKELTDLAKREGLAALGLQLTWSEEIIALIAQNGYDRRYGARPLQRTIEKLLVAPLAKWRIAHPTLKNGTLRLFIADDGSIQVEYTARPGEVALP